MSKKIFCLNALFDLQLGGYPTASVEKSAAEMSPLIAFLGNHDDRALLDVDVPREYWEYLSACGIDHALPLKSGESGSGYEAVPWGWNEQSLARLSRLGAACGHPDLSIVKTVNSRAWCAAFNRQTGTGVPGSCFCQTREDFARAAKLLAGKFPLVAKPDHGGSGRGFVRVPDGKADDPNVVRLLDRLFEQGGCALEPWCDRLYDVSTSCVINKNGQIEKLRHYRCRINSHGAFVGVTPGMPDAAVDRRRSGLEAAATKAAHALQSAGYFGPASFDSFMYRDRVSGDERLAPVIEINARQVMSAIAYALYEKTGRDGCCLFKFIGRQKLRLPATCGELFSLPGIRWYDPARKTGVLLLSPLRVRQGAEWTQPARSAFFIVAENETALHESDAQLSRRAGFAEGASSRRWQ